MENTLKGMRTILIRPDNGDGVPAYVLKVSPDEYAALEKANLVYEDGDKEGGLAFNHIGVDLLRIADQLSETSPKNFKELVPIFVERKVRKALHKLLKTAPFEGMSYSNFVETSVGSVVRGVTRKVFDVEKVQIELEADKRGVRCSCPKAKDMLYSTTCQVHGSWFTRYKDAMKVIPRLNK